MDRKKAERAEEGEIGSMKLEAEAQETGPLERGDTSSNEVGVLEAHKFLAPTCI